MSRSERLLQLMQMLRRYRYPVTAMTLSQELGISVRSVYRDIASLQAQGANIAGEAGIGYVLQDGFTLPPLMFSAEEIEAIVLGSRWVVERGDEKLAEAARDAFARIQYLHSTREHFPQSRASLLKLWRQQQGIRQI